MATEPSLARHGALPAERWRFVGFILHLLVGFLLLPVVLVVLFMVFVVYWTFVPAYSASAVIPELQTRVLLRFYYTSGQESGRYLTIGTPRGSTTIQMCGFDWAHWGRTSVYRTSDGGLAILGFSNCDYLVARDLAVTHPAREPSEDWHYIGAFDFVSVPQGGPGAQEMQFIPAAEQAECIVMGGSDFVQSWMPRKEARKPGCP